jgi:hypothetical protein
MLYTAARKCWYVMKWLWAVIFLTLLVSLFANLLVLKRTDFSSTIFATQVLTPGFGQTVIFLAIALLVAATLIPQLVLLGEKSNTNDRQVQRYLHEVIKANQRLNPSGFAQLSQALISVSVPLNDIFIHLHAIPDRPIYDIPGEQQKLLEELRQRTDLKVEEREELIQRLRVIWYSQIGQESDSKTQKNNVFISDIFRYMNRERPVAVILGTPGSGKSTTLRWLSLHMARAALFPAYQVPRGDDDDYASGYDDDDNDEYYYYDSLRRIPVLLRVSDYAKQLSRTADLSVEQFFTKQVSETFHELHTIATHLLDEMKKGRCLILFDGLDEVASDALRRQVAQGIDKFINAYSKPRSGSHHWNMFLITSRIVGYESSTFSRYAHYTLLDFEDEQIEQFLTKWCPTVEHYQVMCAQGMKPLTSQQESYVKKQGNIQQKQLLQAIYNNPSIKRLAVNPLMLTILALIQRSGKTLPHRRIELYQIVTRTLLDNWNKESERRVFPVEEVPLAEQLLGNLAYKLHSTDPMLTEQEVKAIARKTMADFYGYANDQVKESEITQFIEILRSSSGLFVESGQGLFNFMHRTFQEYFVALHLLRKTPAELKQFTIEHYYTAIWREPLLLAIAYKSGQSSRTEWQEASQLIQAIRDARDDYDTVLYHNLLLAANSIVDCGAWAIDKQLQQEIAEKLFELHGDIFNRGHYNRLKREIANVALLWLRGQPQDSSQTHTLPPLLSAWCHALQDTRHPDRQQGAVQLLAELAPHLSNCPKSVLAAVVPLLLQLTDTADLFFIEEDRLQSVQLLSAPSIQIAYYAWEALYQLTPRGPLEQLHDEWVAWKDRSEAFARLNDHLVELSIPLSRLEVIHQYLLIKLAEAEVAGNSTQELAWQNCWHATLRKEMARGRFATYLPCLTLRLLLIENDETQQQILAEELLNALSAHDQQVGQILVVIMLCYLNLLERESDENTDKENWPFDYELDMPRNETRKASSRRQLPASYLQSRSTTHANTIKPVRRKALVRAWRPGPARYRRPSMPVAPSRYRSHSRVIVPKWQPSTDEQSFNMKPTLAQRWRRTRRVSARMLREWREDWPTWLPFSLQRPLSVEENTGKTRENTNPEPQIYDETFVPPVATSQQQIWRGKLALPDIPYWLRIWQASTPSMNRDMYELCKMLKRERLVEELCALLIRPIHTAVGIELLTLHIVLATFDSISPTLQQRVNDSLRFYREQTPNLTVEQRLLLDALYKRSSSIAEQYESSDTRATALLRIQKQYQLNKMQVELLLQASIDTRRLINPRPHYSSNTDMDDYGYYEYRATFMAVYEIAWELVRQSFSLEAEAQEVVVQSLESDKAMVCASAAFILQHSKSLLSETRLAAAKKILQILADPVLSRRPLEPPDRLDWQLDNILFETLQTLAEQTQ